MSWIISDSGTVASWIFSVLLTSRVLLVPRAFRSKKICSWEVGWFSWEVSMVPLSYYQTHTEPHFSSLPSCPHSGPLYYMWLIQKEELRETLWNRLEKLYCGMAHSSTAFLSIFVSKIISQVLCLNSLSKCWSLPCEDLTKTEVVKDMISFLRVLWHKGRSDYIICSGLSLRSFIKSSPNGKEREKGRGKAITH